MSTHSHTGTCMDEVLELQHCWNSSTFQSVYNAWNCTINTASPLVYSPPYTKYCILQHRWNLCKHLQRVRISLRHLWYKFTGQFCTIWSHIICNTRCTRRIGRYPTWEPVMHHIVQKAPSISNSIFSRAWNKCPIFTQAKENIKITLNLLINTVDIKMLKLFCVNNIARKI